MLTIALLAFTGSVEAQSWLDALKKTATTVADQVTGGQLTAKALIATWNYTKPGVKLGSSDLASEIGGAALESTVVAKLESVYQMIGIKPGACSFTFNDDETFLFRIGSRELNGSYEFDASSHALTLQFSKSMSLGTFNAQAYLSGSELQIVFPADKLVQLMTLLGSKVSSLSTIAELLKNYDNVCIGFGFSK